MTDTTLEAENKALKAEVAEWQAHVSALHQEFGGIYESLGLDAEDTGDQEHPLSVLVAEIVEDCEHFERRAEAAEARAAALEKEREQLLAAVGSVAQFIECVPPKRQDGDGVEVALSCGEIRRAHQLITALAPGGDDDGQKPEEYNPAWTHGEIGDDEKAMKEARGYRMRPDGSYFKPRG